MLAVSTCRMALERRFRLREGKKREDLPNAPQALAMFERLFQLAENPTGIVAMSYVVCCM